MDSESVLLYLAPRHDVKAHQHCDVFVYLSAVSENNGMTAVSEPQQ